MILPTHTSPSDPCLRVFDESRVWAIHLAGAQSQDRRTSLKQATEIRALFPDSLVALNLQRLQFLNSASITCINGSSRRCRRTVQSLADVPNSRIEIGLSIVTIPFPILHGSGVYRVVVLVGIEQNLTSIGCDPKGES